MKNCKHCNVEILKTDVNYTRKKFCGSDCVWAWRESQTGIQERFWGNVVKTDTCWLYQNLEKDGYGYFRHGVPPNQLQWFAHRFSWTIANGPVPVGLEVCHTCDVRCCVNPAHLFLGTHDQNMKDCAAKGRQARGVGTNRNKLTEAQVLEIIALKGTEPATKVCLRYGVLPGAVSGIWRGERWKHLQSDMNGDR